MKQDLCISSPGGQRGDAFIEALVGVVLMSVIGLGLSYAASRAVVSQRYLNTQNLVVSQVRESLSGNTATLSSMCASSSGPAIQVASNAVATDLQCTKGTVSIGVAGLSTANLPADALVTSVTVATQANDTTAALFGGDGRIAVSM